MTRHILLSIISGLCFVSASATVVRKADAPEAPCGLDGKTIAVWPSHGAYYNSQEDRWKWQRARLFGTVEDLFSQSYVVPFLIPMLENAGAYVMTPRERDYSETENIIDGDGGLAEGHFRTHNGHNHKWSTDPMHRGFAHKEKTLKPRYNPFTAGSVKSVPAEKDPEKAPRAEWYAPIPERGKYAVYVSYASTSDSASDALYRVNASGGSEDFIVDQRVGGGTWIYLGTFDFQAGDSEIPLVELIATSATEGAVVTADAVKIGGGRGNVERGGKVSGHPRRNEGARYWLQWAGMPDSVYSVTNFTDDYVDDYKSRALWVNYLSGGSCKNPGQKGLGIPVDLSLAFHTDAGVTADGSTVGTLGIINYGKRDKLGDGSSKATVEDYADLVTSQIVNDVRALYDQSWTKRPVRNRSYHEASTPVVPALLIELLSHQNFPDMIYGLDPEFRFTVARAVYKGIGRYLAKKEGRKFVTQPLPVNSFSISGSGKEYVMSWKATVDSLETSAKPDYYIVEERIGDGGFTELAVTDSPYINVSPEDDNIYSYRIIAANSGGTSFPSEILSLSNRGTGQRDQVLIVNGFTRVSGPDVIPGSGFDYRSDHGVAAGIDNSFTGEQYDFNRAHEWMSDDAPGFGAGRAYYDKKLLKGNDMDNVYAHGRALHAAGIPFVSASREGFVTSLPESPVVNLILGKQKEIHTGKSKTGATRKTFTPELQNALTRFLERGGRLLVSGSYLSTDIAENPYSSSSQKADDVKWLRETLGVVHSSDKATVTGEVSGVKSPFASLKLPHIDFNTALSADFYAVESPSSFTPAPGGAIIMRYDENGYPAATAIEKDSYKVVAAGFPLETITDVKVLGAFMRNISDFFKAPVSNVRISETKAVDHRPKASSTKKSSKSKTKRTKKRKKR
ncbi:MAG: xanthan lyase [Duncaniella sp.]|nr:xanthan lyase [Duncaniella sp.]